MIGIDSQSTGPMDILSPLILLQENGYKALGRTKGEDDLRLVMADLRDKIVRVGDGDLQKEPNLPTVEHDSGQIYQVVVNLLLNAVQSIDGAGTIRVEISLLKGDAAITVMDTGRGIEPEHLPNIFRPFYTTNRNGTGLGLSLARRTAEEHHGRMEVTSEVGSGATFSVVLPLQQVRSQVSIG
jgi:signal transduction histidine kinase